MIFNRYLKPATRLSKTRLSKTGLCTKLFLVLAIYGATQVAASQSTTEIQATAIFAEINSPFCKGRLLKDCPSSGATQLKQEIRDMVAAGQDKNTIINQLYARYGEDEIRAIPNDSNMGTFAWLGPFIFLAIAGSLIFIWLRKNIPPTQT